MVAFLSFRCARGHGLLFPGLRIAPSGTTDVRTTPETTSERLAAHVPAGLSPVWALRSLGTVSSGFVVAVALAMTCQVWVSRRSRR